MKKLSICPDHTLAAVIFSSFFLFIFIGCRKNPLPPPDSNPAHGYFPADKNGICGGSTIVHGIWYNGLPINTDTNYVDVSVYVTSPGSYKISSDTLNGVFFTGSGEFPDSGLTTARLKATGSFNTFGDATFRIHFDSSDCQFGIAVNDSAGLSIGANMWRFTAEGHTYSGPFTAQSFDIPESSGTDFELDGFVTGSADTAFMIALNTSSGYGSLPVGSYLTSGSSLDFLGLYTTTPNGGIVKSIYQNSTAAGAVDTIKIESIITLLTPYYHTTVVATFSGMVLNSEGKLVPLTNGKFKWGAP